MDVKRESELQLIVHPDMMKVMGGRTYYFAERHTEKGAHGFWVQKAWYDDRNKLAK
jgi:hypothetical protein